MSTINGTAYRQLLTENLEWLLNQPRTLERDHIEQVLKWHDGNAESVCDLSRLQDQYKRLQAENQRLREENERLQSELRQTTISADIGKQWVKEALEGR